MKRALIIDGNNFYNISYYAAKSRGFGDYVAIGFFQRLNDAYKAYESEHDFLFVVWDSKVSRRKEKYSFYKAQRSPKPDGFYDMLPYVKNTLAMRKVQQYEMEGFEEDDIIAKLVEMCRDKGYSVTVASSDHDMYQLIDDNITIYDPLQKKIVDKDDFKKMNSIEPMQWKYVKALMGDTSDNIVGVQGIGEKFAIKIVQEYGNLDNLYSSDMKKLAKGIVAKLTKQEGEYDAKKSAYESLDLIEFMNVELPYPTDAGISPEKVNGSIYVEMGF